MDSKPVPVPNADPAELARMATRFFECSSGRKWAQGRAPLFHVPYDVPLYALVGAVELMKKRFPEIHVEFRENWPHLGIVEAPVH